ncbi:MAG: M1 family metallopeptidase [Clostridiales bacterium]|nr:M1 family metallopeptidase [Clostridiales bacterium]
MLCACSGTAKTPGPSVSVSELPLQESHSPTPSATPAPALQPVSRYNVELTVSPVERTVTGIMRVSFTNTTPQPMFSIYINAPLNAFESGSPVPEEFNGKTYANGLDYGYIHITSADVDNDPVQVNVTGTVIEISLSEQLQPNNRLELRLGFEAKVPMINHRTGANEHAIWFGNFLPTLAVYDEFGWHTEPYYSMGDPFYTEAADYNVSISTPLDYIVVGTGEQTTSATPDTKVSRFSATLARDFAFAISNEYVLSTLTTKTGVYIDLYTYTDITNKDYVLTLAEKSLDWFSSQISPYPFQQLVIAEVGLFGSIGMEYPQIVFIDSEYLRTSEKLESLAHEIGHQWFYNIIGNNQIDNAWMDEGLTTFVQEGIFGSKADINSKMWDNYSYLEDILTEPTEPTTRRLSSRLNEFTKWSDYYRIHYLRGELMFYALAEELGEDGFKQFLGEYYRRFAFKIATPEDLIDTAEDSSGQDLTCFFDGWINDETLPPFPNGGE